MYAIVEIAGQQFKVEEGRKLYVHRLAGKEGSSLSFDKVLLTDNDGQVQVGSPVLKGVNVNAMILRHLKDDKVLVFKKKRRKGYQVKNGHRQYLTQIEIIGFGTGAAKSAETAAAKAAPTENAAVTKSVAPGKPAMAEKPAGTKTAAKPVAGKPAAKPKPTAKPAAKKTEKV